VGNSCGQPPPGIGGMGPSEGPPAFIKEPDSFGAGGGVLDAGEDVLGGDAGVLGLGEVFGLIEPPLGSPGPPRGVGPQSSTRTVYSTLPPTLTSILLSPSPDMQEDVARG
jgi:hypothetical protein